MGKRKVAAVFALAKLFCQAQKPLAVDVAHVIGDLLDAGDLNWNGPGRLAVSGLGLGAASCRRCLSDVLGEWPLGPRILCVTDGNGVDCCDAAGPASHRRDADGARLHRDCSIDLGDLLQLPVAPNALRLIFARAVPFVSSHLAVMRK